MGKKLNIADYVGKTFGYLTIISDAGSVFDSGCYRTIVKAKCKCGKEVEIIFRNIKAGVTKSCGCYHKELLIERLTVHEKYNQDIWAVANGWKKGLQIDRINNYGNYEPLNCRIVTNKQNSRNRSAIVARFKRGWSVEKTFTTPSLKRTA